MLDSFEQKNDLKIVDKCKRKGSQQSENCREPLCFVVYCTVNFAVALLVSEPDFPVKVSVYTPGTVLFGKRIPEMARAFPFTEMVCGRSAHFEPTGPPEQLRVTFPLKPFTDCTTNRNAATSPRLIVSEPGSGVIVKPGPDEDCETVKLWLTVDAAE
jgi:hypothetical protein